MLHLFHINATKTLPDSRTFKMLENWITEDSNQESIKWKVTLRPITEELHNLTKLESKETKISDRSI